jgi:hypothetical protein
MLLRSDCGPVKLDECHVWPPSLEHRQVVLAAGEARPTDVDPVVALVDGQRLLVVLLAESDRSALHDRCAHVGHGAGGADVVLGDRKSVGHGAARLAGWGPLERDEREVEVPCRVEAQPRI